MHEFLGVVTHPRIFSPATPIDIALSAIDSWRARPNTRLLSEDDTWIAIEDVYRRAGRFRDLQEKMRMTLIDLSLCGTWEGLRHSVMRTERILFNEVLEWHSIARYSATD